MDALAGERVDQAGGVAGEQDAALGCIRVASQAEVLPGNVCAGQCRQIETQLPERVAVQQSARDGLVLHAFGDGSGALFCRPGDKTADADVDVIGLGKEPAIAAGDRGEVKDEIVRLIAGRKSGGQQSVGNGGFERETAGIPYRLGG